MGEATGQESGGAIPNVAPSEFRSWSEEVEVQLGPADVWVLGQLIEAGTASFPPEIAQELMTGYRILQGAGYQPPPTRGHTSVELEATLEDPRPEGAGDADAGDPEPRPGDAGERENRSSEVLVTEVPGERAGPEDEPDEHLAPHGLLAREVVLTEVTAEPAPAAASEELTEHVEQAVASLDRIADRLERAAPTDAGTSGSGSTDRTPTDARVREATIDLGLAGADAAAASLFVVAAALLADPVFAVLGLAATGLGAFLVLPYLDLPFGGAALLEGEQELDRLAGATRSPSASRRLRRLAAFGAVAVPALIATVALAGNAAHQWGYVGAFVLAGLLGLACAARVSASGPAARG